MRNTEVRYQLPTYYHPEPLKRTCSVFIFVGTTFERVCEIINDILDTHPTIEAVKLHVEIRVDTELVERVEAYLTEHIDAPIEVLDVLHVSEMLIQLAYVNRVFVYHQALKN